MAGMSVVRRSYEAARRSRWPRRRRSGAAGPGTRPGGRGRARRCPRAAGGAGSPRPGRPTARTPGRPAGPGDRAAPRPRRRTGRASRRPGSCGPSPQPESVAQATAPTAIATCSRGAIGRCYLTHHGGRRPVGVGYPPPRERGRYPAGAVLRRRAARAAPERHRLALRGGRLEPLHPAAAARPADRLGQHGHGHRVRDGDRDGPRRAASASSTASSPWSARWRRWRG